MIHPHPVILNPVFAKAFHTQESRVKDLLRKVIEIFYVNI
jgi:hypothetical protein